MANKIKNNSTQGLYFSEEQGGAIVANTPGEIDLALLALGDTYIYFDTILRFERKKTYNREENFTGFKTFQNSITSPSIQSNTGSGKRAFFMVTVECDETTAELLEQFCDRNVVSGDGIKYLIKQTASEAFRQFPNAAFVLKKFAAVIIRGIDVVEIANNGKDVQVVNIACEEINARET